MKLVSARDYLRVDRFRLARALVSPSADDTEVIPPAIKASLP